MGEIDQFTYRTITSKNEQQCVGLCAEFPNLCWRAKSHEEALTGVRALVMDTVEAMRRENRPVPVALALRAYSGTFRVRVPPDVHRSLTLEAARAGVSLSRLATMKLSA